MKNKSKKFICAECNGEFIKGRSDEEALAEKEMLYGDLPIEEMVVVCENCYNALRKNQLFKSLNLL